MSDPDMPTDDKYIVFKRAELLEHVSPQAMNMATAQAQYEMMLGLALKDAVVIRRQDKFASPCLLTYAVMIAMVGEHHPDPKIRAELLDIADYFSRQGELAGDEAWKLPDL